MLEIRETDHINEKTDYINEKTDHINEKTDDLNKEAIMEQQYYQYVQKISGLSKEQIIKNHSPDFNLKETYPFISMQVHKTKNTQVFDDYFGVDESISDLVYWLNKDFPLTTNSCHHTTYGWVHIHCNWIIFYKWWYHINNLNRQMKIKNGLLEYLNFDNEIKNERQLIKISMGPEPRIYFELSKSDVNKMVTLFEDLYRIQHNNLGFIK